MRFDLRSTPFNVSPGAAGGSTTNATNTTWQNQNSQTWNSATPAGAAGAGGSGPYGAAVRATAAQQWQWQAMTAQQCMAGQAMAAMDVAAMAYWQGQADYGAAIAAKQMWGSVPSISCGQPSHVEAGNCWEGGRGWPDLRVATWGRGEYSLQRRRGRGLGADGQEFFCRCAVLRPVCVVLTEDSIFCEQNVLKLSSKTRTRTSR